MTIEEAIKHCGEVADSKCDACGAEHRQLAEWLKELKERRNGDSNILTAREDFMHIVYNELSDDEDNLRANRIIDAADGYADSFKEYREDNYGANKIIDKSSYSR